MDRIQPRLLSEQAQPIESPGRDILRAIAGRRSVRAYLDRPVPQELLETILDTARWAPSGANMQPWKVRVLTGGAKERVTRALLAARAAEAPEQPDYSYYPLDWFEPYKSRRMALGMSMYRRPGGPRTPESRREAWNRNYAFFGAPVAMLFFLDAGLSTGSWLDYGMFIQNVMLAARASGLESCPQASLADYPEVIRNVLDIPSDQKLICALSLGYADWRQPVNTFERVRAEVRDFAHFFD